jgi:ubiquinone/menaquinone biosynthesis C-methylase UbiE
MINKLIDEWQSTYDKKNFSRMVREPYFNIAAKYLPKDKDSKVVDIGAGNGAFADQLGLNNKFNSLYLLDGNEVSVKNLKKNAYTKATFYLAPSKLPFKDKDMDFIHCSHLIEHLSPDELYDFLKEIDRVLKRGGIIVISAPMLWQGFYDDLTHKRPYNPSVLINYLCIDSENRSRKSLSAEYMTEELVYRYTDVYPVERINSDLKLIDWALFLFYKINTRLFRIRKYSKTGFTIVLRKS